MFGDDFAFEHRRGDPDGPLMLNMLAILAEYELELILEWVNAGTRSTASTVLRTAARWVPCVGAALISSRNPSAARRATLGWVGKLPSGWMQGNGCVFSRSGAGRAIA
ncbi:recombinase family protein [Arthrobacter sp. BE255]|uniref:recombinase family protein n=1 Tax=Arthrobacter sp. BE255 TaxID=2817721 RepID=UPI00286A9FD1|nr:recombinase family protein [Arthrobacter sp. BE255]